MSTRKLLALTLCLGCAAEMAAHGQPPRTEEQVAAAETPRSRTDRYGDALPAGAIARLGTLRFRHTKFVDAVAFSPDGKRVASGGRDGWVYLWDKATGKKVFSLAMPPGSSAHRLLFAPDGRTLIASDCPDWGAKVLRVWEIRTGRERFTVQFGNDALLLLAVSPDNRTLAAACQHSIRRWDLAMGEEQKSSPNPAAHPCALAYLPDKTLVIVGRDADGRQLHLWDATTGKEIRRFVLSADPGGWASFSADAQFLAAPGEENSVYLWKTATGKRCFRLRGHTARVESLAFSADGKRLASESEEEVRVWDTETGRELRTFSHLKCPMGCLALSADGGCLAAPGCGFAVRLWDAATGTERVPALGHTFPAQTFAFTPDGRTLHSIGEDGLVASWDPASGEPRRSFHRDEWHLYRSCICPDGRTAVALCKDQKGRVVDLAEGRQLRSWTLPPEELQSPTLTPDGKQLVSLDRWTLGFSFLDLDTFSRRCVLQGQGNSYSSAAFTPDGRTLATGDKTLRLWDLPARQMRSEFPKERGRVEQLAFSPDGRCLATIGGDALVLWESSTGKQLLRAPGMVTVAFAPKGRLLSAADKEGVLVFWDLPSLRRIGELPGHGCLAGSLVFGPDGRTLASRGFDTTILVWDLAPMRAKSIAARPRAASPREFAHCWEDLAGADAVKAHRSAWALSAAGEAAVAWMKDRLQPAMRDNEPPLERLMADLGAEDFATREKATRELKRLGERAEPKLRKLLQETLDPEVRRRAALLLKGLERVSPGLPPGEELRAVRAVPVLEHVGTAEATRLLAAVARGASGAHLTREAKASLDRLAERPSE